jgi:hypothetical protein
MIVTKNSFTAYQLLPGTMAMQIALIGTLSYVFIDRDILTDPAMLYWFDGTEHIY